MCVDEDCSFGMHRMVAARACKMWLEFVTILLNSSSSAEEQR